METDGVATVLRAIDAGAHTFTEIEAASRIPDDDLRRTIYVAAEHNYLTNGEDHEPGWFLTLLGANYLAGSPDAC